MNIYKFKYKLVKKANFLVGEKCIFLHLQRKHEDGFVGKNYTQHFCNNTLRVHNNKFKKKKILYANLSVLLSVLWLVLNILWLWLNRWLLHDNNCYDNPAIGITTYQYPWLVSGSDKRCWQIIVSMKASRRKLCFVENIIHKSQLFSGKNVKITYLHFSRALMVPLKKRKKSQFFIFLNLDEQVTIDKFALLTVL